jgi:hypothetical protein
MPMPSIFTKEDIECGRPHQGKNKRPSAYGEWYYSEVWPVVPEKRAQTEYLPIGEIKRPDHRRTALQRVLTWQFKFSRDEPEITSGVGDERTPAEREFEEQKQAFERIPPSDLAPYHGQYVAVRNGIIVDSDYDPIELSRRFYERFGGVPVYKTRIGKRRVVNIPTPFLR